MAVLKELRQQDDKLPIIVVTARTDERDRLAALQAGANDFITKPFRFMDLLARIQAQLE